MHQRGAGEHPPAHEHCQQPYNPSHNHGHLTFRQARVKLGNGDDTSLDANCGGQGVEGAATCRPTAAAWRSATAASTSSAC